MCPQLASTSALVINTPTLIIHVAAAGRVRMLTDAPASFALLLFHSGTLVWPPRVLTVSACVSPSCIIRRSPMKPPHMCSISLAPQLPHRSAVQYPNNRLPLLSPLYANHTLLRCCAVFFPDSPQHSIHQYTFIRSSYKSHPALVAHPHFPHPCKPFASYFIASR